jgi:hypothetical protein
MLTAMLAGCSDAPATEPTSSFDAPDATTTATTGGIRGVVIDPTITPVIGAAVMLDGTKVATETDDAGGFAFSDVEPGIYFIAVQSDGHLSAQQSVEVTAGFVEKVRIMVQIDQRPAPYHQSLKFDGFIGLWAPGPSYVVQLVYPDDDVCKCQMQVHPDGNISNFVFEAFWEASVTVPEFEDMSWEFDSYEGESLDNQEGEYAPSPIYGNLDRELYSQNSDNWLARVTPGIAAGVYVQQNYEMFVTSFHLAPGPDGWSINDPS